MDTERYRPIDPDVYTIIANCGPDDQLNPMSTQLIQWLYEEATVYNYISPSPINGHVRINLCELNKLTNRPDEPNRWVVWRRDIVPSFEDMLFYKINYDFYKKG